MQKDTLERVSALAHYAMGTKKVKVIFRDGGHKATIEEREEKAYWMDSKTYDAIPLGVTAFVADYKKFGPVVEAKNCDIYDIEEQK